MLSLKLPSISVVIPVYNAEKYIGQCIDSILNQSFRDFEVLLVNDGSRDSSGKICDQYAQQDNRIKVIHQVNGGVTSARRVGVSKSISEWICFVDADDSLPQTALDDFWKEASTGKFNIICGRYDDQLGYKEDCLTPDQYTKTLMSGEEIHIAPWGRLIAKKLFKDGLMDIPRKITRGEDLLMNIRLSFNNDMPVRLLNKNVYNYFVNSTSCTANFNNTIDYESSYYPYLLSSIPSDKLAMYKAEVLKIALKGIEQIADGSKTNIWKDTEYFKMILDEIDLLHFPISKLRRTRLLTSSTLLLRLYTIVIKIKRRLHI